MYIPKQKAHHSAAHGPLFRNPRAHHVHGEPTGFVFDGVTSARISSSLNLR